MKLFEAPAVGWAVVTDAIVVLGALSFVDGQSIITLENFDESVDKVRH